MLFALELSQVIDIALSIANKAFQCDLWLLVFFSQRCCSQHQCESHNWSHEAVNWGLFEWCDYDYYYRQIVQEKATLLILFDLLKCRHANSPQLFSSKLHFDYSSRDDK